MGKSRARLTESKPWTDADEKKLRKLLKADTPRKEVYAAFHGDRSIPSVRAKIKLLGLNVKRHWTAEEDENLRVMWSALRPFTEIQKELGRSALSVYCRAVHHLRLKGGCPPGWEYLVHAAQRVGLSVLGLRRVLREAGFKVYPAFSNSKAEKRRPGRPKKVGRYSQRGHRNVVRPYEVDDAVHLRDSTETLEQAANKRLVYARDLKQWLIDAGMKPPPRNQHWRIPTKDIDRIVADREAMLRSHESLTAAAARHGTTKETLGPWLRKAGVKYTRGLVPKHLVDKIVARKFADPFCKASPKYHTEEYARKRAEVAHARKLVRDRKRREEMTPEEQEAARLKKNAASAERMRRIRAAKQAEQPAAA